MSEIPRLRNRQLPRVVTTDNALAKLNQLIAETGLLLPQKTPAFNYFKQGATAFCWNVEPLTPNPRTRNREWAAWKYRVNKQKGTWRRIGNPVFFAKRKSAKKKALQWYHKARDKKRTPSPIPSSTAAATTPNTLPPTTT